MESKAIIGIDLADGPDSTVRAYCENGDYVFICDDYDDECVDVKNKSACWFYNPSTGVCPYLYKRAKP